MRFGIDPRAKTIPVVAAAHYHMGGVAVDLHGRTDVRGLYACGEVAATGVHGANRLASNSLLESVVYPERIARDVRAHFGAGARADGTAVDPAPGAVDAEEDAARWLELRDEMYAHVGIERDEAGLTIAAERFRAFAESSPSETFRDAATTASLVARAALRRRESRGSHRRSDYPATASDERHRSFSTLAPRRSA